jgi:hypothetical protein
MRLSEIGTVSDLGTITIVTWLVLLRCILVVLCPRFGNNTTSMPTSGHGGNTPRNVGNHHQTMWYYNSQNKKYDTSPARKPKIAINYGGSSV